MLSLRNETVKRIGSGIVGSSGEAKLMNPWGYRTYLFMVGVDGLYHGMNTVVRGRGMSSTTALERVLADMIGLEAPTTWLHQEDIMELATSKKLSEGAAPRQSVSVWTPVQIYNFLEPYTPMKR